MLPVAPPLVSGISARHCARLASSHSFTGDSSAVFLMCFFKMKCRILGILCCLLLNAYRTQANDVTGCGGFVVSSVNINYSPIKIKLYAFAYHFTIVIFYHCFLQIGTRAKVCSSFKLMSRQTMAIFSYH